MIKITIYKNHTVKITIYTVKILRILINSQ